MGIYDQGYWLVSRFGPDVRDRARPRVLGPAHQPDRLPLRAVLLAGRRTHVPDGHPGRMPRRRRRARVPDRPRPAEPVARARLRRRVPVLPGRAVHLVGQLPPRGDGHHAVPVRLVVRPARAVAGRTACARPRADHPRGRRARRDGARRRAVGAAVARRRRAATPSPGGAAGCPASRLVGAGWYLFCTKLAIPHFNNGEEPFYVAYFYSDWGTTMGEVAGNIMRHPNRVVSAATQPDRLRFYRDLFLPLGGFPIAASACWPWPGRRCWPASSAPAPTPA